MSDRINEITIGNTGTIKAAVQQATTDAKQIAEMKDHIAKQQETIDRIAKEAGEFRGISLEINQEKKSGKQSHYQRNWGQTGMALR